MSRACAASGHQDTVRISLPFRRLHGKRSDGLSGTARQDCRTAKRAQRGDSSGGQHDGAPEMRERQGTDTSGVAHLPGFCPSVEPLDEAGRLLDQTLREKAGTLAALSNANQQLASHHQFRALCYQQVPCHGQGASPGDAPPADKRRFNDRASLNPGRTHGLGASFWAGSRSWGRRFVP